MKNIHMFVYDSENEDIPFNNSHLIDENEKTFEMDGFKYFANDIDHDKAIYRIFYTKIFNEVEKVYVKEQLERFAKVYEDE